MLPGVGKEFPRTALLGVAVVGFREIQRFCVNIREGHETLRDLDTLIVYCHPYDLSFNHAVLTAVEAGLDRANRTYEVCDLYADGFDPTMRAADLATYNEGSSADPLVARYQSLIERAERLVFVYPVWWNDMPALLKGWFDKVMLVGFSWKATGQGLVGTLGDRIGHVDVYTTSSESTEHLREAISTAFTDGTLAQLGISERAWYNFGGLDQSSVKEREAWLMRVEEREAARR